MSDKRELHALGVAVAEGQAISSTMHMKKSINSVSRASIVIFVPAKACAPALLPASVGIW